MFCMINITRHHIVTRSSAVAKRPRDASCLYSFNTKRRAHCSLLLLVVSASDIPLRTIKFFSVLFSSAYSSMLQAVTNKHSLVSRRLCDLHCMVVGNCFCHFVVRTSNNRSIANVRGRLCHILSFGKCFWHFARPAIFDSQLLDQNRDFCLYPTCIRLECRWGECE